MAKPVQLPPWPDVVQFPSTTPDIRFTCDWSMFVNASSAAKKIYLAIQSQGGNELQGMYQHIRLLVGLYKTQETHPGQVLLDPKAPEFPFLFSSPRRELAWEGVGTDDVLMALRYGCLGMASLYYIEGSRQKVSKTIFSNLKHAARFLSVANVICAPSLTISSSPVERIGGLHLISYVYEYCMYTVARETLMSSTEEILLWTELKRLGLMHEELGHVQRETGKLLKDWCAKEILRCKYDMIWVAAKWMTAEKGRRRLTGTGVRTDNTNSFDADVYILQSVHESLWPHELRTTLRDVIVDAESIKESCVKKQIVDGSFSQLLVMHQRPLDAANAPGLLQRTSLKELPRSSEESIEWIAHQTCGFVPFLD